MKIEFPQNEKAIHQTHCYLNLVFSFYIRFTWRIEFTEHI